MLGDLLVQFFGIHAQLRRRKNQVPTFNFFYLKSKEGLKIEKFATVFINRMLNLKKKPVTNVNTLVLNIVNYVLDIVN